MRYYLIIFFFLFINQSITFAQESDAETIMLLKLRISEEMKKTSDSVYLTKPLQINHTADEQVNDQYYTLKRISAEEDEKYINPLFAPFYHGVASGDPLSDRVIIWTRVTPSDSLYYPVSVKYYVSASPDFSSIIRQGTVITDTSKDYTVKIDVDGLQADTYYYYYFEALGKNSLTGRTKTTANGTYSNLKLVLLTGSDYRRGYFNSLARLSERNDIDLIFHSGDYIYEQGGGPSDRLHEPDAEIYRLQDYRTRISQYRLDTMLMRCHQLYPWVIIWDDHDVVVDALRDTSYRHDATSFGLYKDRKNAAVKAFREWMPVRDDTASYYKNWRKTSFGNLADFYAVDVRLYDRDRFADDIFDTIYNHPDAKIIGPEQMDWLTSEMSGSQAQWKIVGGGLMFSQLKVASVPLVLENWDGYPYERNKIFDCIEQHNVDNTIFLSGDFHCSFACDVARTPYNILNYNPLNGNGSLAVEFLPPALASDNFDEGNDYGLGASNATLAANLIKSVNPHIKYVDLTGQGYVLLDITPQRAQGEFWFSQNILDPENTTETCAQIWKTNDQENHLTQTTHIAPAKPNVPAAPPFSPTAFAGINEVSNKLPIILSSYPNPFSAYTYLNFVLNEKSNLKVYITDSRGTEVMKILNQLLTPGNYTFYINGKNLDSGMYLLIIENNQQKLVHKLIKN